MCHQTCCWGPAVALRVVGAGLRSHIQLWHERVLVQQLAGETGRNPRGDKPQRRTVGGNSNEFNFSGKMALEGGKGLVHWLQDTKK